MNFLVVSPEAGRWKSPSPLVQAVNHMTDAYARVGIEVVTCSPFYPHQLGDFSSFKCIFEGIEELHHLPFQIWKGKDARHTYIYNSELFNRPSIYGEHVYAYADNHIRFSFLASAALSYCKTIGYKPSAVLGHEWGAALTGALMQTTFSDFYSDLPFFFTVHNITYDCHVYDTEIEHIGLNRKDYNMDGYEFWGKVSLLKVGLFYARTVLFPSPGYRDSMLKSNLPGGLSGFLNHNEKKLKGIQFGVSYSLWDFNLKTGIPICEAKKKARKDFETQVNASFQDKLVIYTHLDNESGKTSETLATIISDITKLNAFLVVGILKENPDWNYYQSLVQEYPQNIAILDIFESKSALRVSLAGADLLFASNLQEPSASLVLKALASGTVPLSGKDVGVANLLHNFEGDSTLADALLVEDSAAPHQMLRRLREAESLYCNDKSIWEKIVSNAYLFRYEWDRTISQYLLTLGEH